MHLFARAAGEESAHYDIFGAVERAERGVASMGARMVWILAVLVLGGLVAYFVSNIGSSDSAYRILEVKTPGFDPPSLSVHALRWSLPFAVLLLAVAVIASERIKDQHRKFVGTDSREERLVAALQDEGYDEIDPTSYRDADGGEVTFRTFALREEPANANLLSGKIVLLDNEEKLEFGYSVLLDDYSWEPNSEFRFVGSGLEEALANDQIREKVRRANRVIAVGLASSELDRLSARENESLSDARGMNLAIALLRLNYVDGRTKSIASVGAGYALGAPSAGQNASAQRPAIIVSVISSDWELTVEQFVLSINNHIQWVDLEHYSRRPAQFSSCQEFEEPYDYVPRGEVCYSQRASDTIVPVIQDGADASHE